MTHYQIAVFAGFPACWSTASRSALDRSPGSFFKARSIRDGRGASPLAALALSASRSEYDLISLPASGTTIVDPIVNPSLVLVICDNVTPFFNVVHLLHLRQLCLLYGEASNAHLKTLGSAFIFPSSSRTVKGFASKSIVQ